MWLHLDGNPAWATKWLTSFTSDVVLSLDRFMLTAISVIQSSSMWPSYKKETDHMKPKTATHYWPKDTNIYIQSSPTLLNLEFKKLFNGLIAVNEILIILRAYRPPAVPLHRAVVVFHHPGMIQQLSNSKTSLGVHLQDTKGIYTSVDNRRHISLYTRHQLAAPEHPRVHGVICLHVRVREMSLKLLN